MARARLTITYDEDGDWDLVRLVGPMDENGSLLLPEIEAKVGKRVRLDFRGVDHINSSGVRAWITFLRAFREGREIVLCELPPNLVIQLNMIPSFYEGCRIESVYGNYFCDHCGHEVMARFSEEDGMPTLGTRIPPIPCPKCKRDMGFEEDDSFFAFASS